MSGASAFMAATKHLTSNRSCAARRSRLWRFHDLVRLVRRRRSRGYDAGSEIRGPLAERGLARGAWLCCRALPHACAASVIADPMLRHGHHSIAWT